MKEFWNEGTNFKHVKYYYQDGDECKSKMILYSLFGKRHDLRIESAFDGVASGTIIASMRPMILSQNRLLALRKNNNKLKKT